MSHGVFHYLMHLDLEESDEALKAAAESEFESYAEHHTDENNWSANIALVTKDGRYLPYKDKDSRYDLGKITWDEARLYALRCVATDFEINGVYAYSLGLPDPERAKLDQMGFGDLIKAIHEQIPPKIVNLYEKLQADLKLPPPVEKDWARDYGHYQRSKLVRSFELFMRSVMCPFSPNWDTPYAYRCYDLTGGDTQPKSNESTGNAILMMDIHT